ncbi:unnamed protein product [Ceratitis capitata]|uniref:(Mediterranean fruit fly) hypothetical protein n=1 Tax=Ceratitis capitata TaxID=7213 RepID=A0A811UIW1_CERCA|nr:unnamed protein product [Ceratitis capitata]
MEIIKMETNLQQPTAPSATTQATPTPVTTQQQILPTAPQPPHNSMSTSSVTPSVRQQSQQQQQQQQQQQHHLPLDYSLGNFKPAVASDFPSNFVSGGGGSSTSNLPLRDLNMRSNITTTTIPNPTQLLQQRVQQQHGVNDQTQDYQPVSAFKAVLPKKKIADGK